MTVKNRSLGRLYLYTFIPYILTVVLITVFFGLWFNIPYTIQTDAAHQIKSIQQYLSGIASIPNALVVPDPNNLSQDIEIWISWWPPGIPIFFSPLIAAGLPLGLAVRVTSFLLLLAGCCGWISVANILQTTILTRIILSFVLPLYAIGSATYAIYNLSNGDIIPFAIMPWLLTYCIYINSKIEAKEPIVRKHFLHLVLLCFLLGCIYWLKYSAFLVSCGIFLALVTTYFKYQNHSNRYFSIFFLLLIFLIPFGGLTLLNKVLSDSEIAVQQFESAGFDSFGVRGPGIVITALGTLGLSMFQSGDWLRSLMANSQFLHRLSFANPTHSEEAISLIYGIPGTLAVAWFTWWTRKFHPKSLLRLCFFVVVVPLVGLFYLSIKIGFNFLAEPVIRYSSSFIVLLEIVFISSCLYVLFNSTPNRSDGVSSSKLTYSNISLKFISAVLLLLIVAAPSFFIVKEFFYGYSRLVDNRANYIATKTQLFQPTLSERNARRIVNQINSLVTSSKDVIVLNIPEYPAYAESWLELKHRTLPLGLHGPLGVLTEKVRQGLTTSKDMRVILVGSNASDESDQEFKRLTGLFSQATQWTSVSMPRHSKVSVWFSDIKASS